MGGFGAANLWIYGYAIYDDIFGNRQTHQFFQRLVRISGQRPQRLADLRSGIVAADCKAVASRRRREGRLQMPASRRVRSSLPSPVGIGSKKWRDQPVCPPSAPGKLLTGFGAARSSPLAQRAASPSAWSHRRGENHRRPSPTRESQYAGSVRTTDRAIDSNHSDQPAACGRQVCCGMRQSMPSSR
jgi:hypothetical protein